MKLKDSQSKKSIFLHITEPSVPINNFEFIDISKIKKIKKNSVSNLYIGDLLDYISTEDGVLLLKELDNKLISGGKLYIQSYDSKCVAASLTYSTINSIIYKNILFNNGNKKNIYNLFEIKNLLNSSMEGTIIKCRFINAIQYYIEYKKL